MIKLLKFEMKKRWKASLMVLLGYFMVYSIALLKFKTDVLRDFKDIPLRVIFFVLIAGLLIFIAFLSGVNSLRSEIKSSSRNLYFTLPVRSYSQIGSKIIVALLEMTVAYGVAFVTCLKAIESLTGFNIMNYLSDGPVSAVDFLSDMYVQMIVYIIILLISYLAFAMLKTVFSEIKFGGFLTFITYVLMMYFHVRYIFPFLWEKGTNQPGLEIFFITTYAIFVFIGVAYLFENKVSME